MDHRVLVSADVIFDRKIGNATRRRKRFINRVYTPERKMRVETHQSEQGTKEREHQAEKGQSKERKDKKAADVGTPTLKRKQVKSDYSVDTVYSSDSSKGSKSKKEEPTAKRPKYINLK